MKFKSEVPVEKYNTNNAWGFGGSYGKQWTLPNGYTYRKGKACFRHLPCQAVAYGRNAMGARITDEEFKAACAEWLA